MPDTTRPNVLFVLSDDHAAHAISAYTDAGLGPELMRTPNLDRLAAEGFRAEDCFCTNAICTPSRASILTGQHPHACGVRTLHDSLDNAHEPQIQQLLSRVGYRTGVFGKWHLGAGPQPGGGNADPAGFDEWAVVPNQGEYFDPSLFVGGRHGRDGELQKEGYVTNLITGMGTAFLDGWDERRQNGVEEPFFLCVHHKAPHRSWEPGPRKRTSSKTSRCPSLPRSGTTTPAGPRRRPRGCVSTRTSRRRT